MNSATKHAPGLAVRMAAMLAAMLLPASVHAALEVEIVTAPNFVVDSNVLTPATYAPEAAMIGAKFCNTGAAPLTNVRMHVGDYAGAGIGTPGVYPQRLSSSFGSAHPHLYRVVDGGYYSLTHEGGSAGTGDAFRYVAEIPAGECVAQYWLVSYPTTSSDEKGASSLLDPRASVTGGSVGPEDDLWLEYDVWAQADGGATAAATGKATMRNEISSAANKIWPNGDNKVPLEYREAIDKYLGWSTQTPSGTADTYPGDVALAQGVWYDFGVIGAGFDNDGDLVPDHNAWAQPIGDAGAYDPGCFRLASTEAYVLVKRQDGSVDVYDYKDRLYFENMPDNTGAVGLVFYRFVALDGKCTAALSPYQEVASGYDNEKFNGDYGVGTPPLQSVSPSGDLPISKNGPAAVTVPALAGGWADLAYSIEYKNNRTAPEGSTGVTLSVGDPDSGTPLVVRDAVPTGTYYKIGSAQWTLPIPTADGQPIYVPGAILFSTDGGSTWSTGQPADGNGDGYADAADVRIQWWLASPLPSTEDKGDFSVKVEFKSGVPYGYSGSSVIPNTGELAIGTGPTINEATTATLVSGPNSLSGTVFKDLDADGAYDAPGEPTLRDVEVKIYADLGVAVIDGKLDVDGDGAITLADDGSFGGRSIVDGFVDLSGDGLITLADDGTIGLDGAWTVVDGRVDVNGSGLADAADDGRIWDGVFDESDVRIGGSTVIGGKLDVNGDGLISAADDGSFDGYSVVDGMIDWNGAGGVTTADDGYVGDLNIPYALVGGKLDVDGDGLISAADDGSFDGYAVVDGVLDLDKDGIAGEAGGDNGHVGLLTVPCLVVDGKLDVNGDGMISLADDGSFEGYQVIDGQLDANRNGSIDAGDDLAGVGASLLGGSATIQVVDGNLDIVAGGGITTADDGTIYARGLSVVAGVIDWDHDWNVAGDAGDQGTAFSKGISVVDGLIDLDGDFVGGESGDAGTVYPDSSSTGTYGLTAKLPDGVYFAMVDTEDPNLFVGASPTTSISHVIKLDVKSASSVGVSSTGNDFGFIEPLDVAKAVTSATSPYGDGETVTYSLTVRNQLPATGSNVGGRCVYTLFPSSATESFGNGWFNVGTAPDPQYALAVDGNSAYTDFSNARDDVDFSGFRPPAATGSIVDMDVVFFGSQLQNPGGTVKDSDATVNLLNVRATNPTSTALISTLLGKDAVLGDLHADGAPWAWSDLDNLTLNLSAVKDGTGGGPTSGWKVDAVALRVTSSEPCPASSSSILADVRLQDRYEKAKLEYVSSTPTRSSEDTTSDPVYNTLVWDDLGPLSPGESKTVVVTMKGKDTAVQVDAHNMALVATGDAKMGDGQLANADMASASATIYPAASISGTLFADKTTGWVAPTGDDPLADDYLAGQVVQLYVCYDNADAKIIFAGTPNMSKECKDASNGGSNGGWGVLAETVTDSNGNYSFTGVLPGFYYVKAPTSVYGGSITTSAGNADTSLADGSPDAFWYADVVNVDTAALSNFLNMSTPTDKANVDFGYGINPSVSGYVWDDANGNGAWDSGEAPLSGVTVTVNGATKTTDANGYYEFTTGLTAGTTYAVVLTTTSGAMSGYSWTQTYEQDGSLGNSLQFTAQAGTMLENRNFGWHWSPAGGEISGTVYYDWNGDGDRDASDVGTAGVTVRLYEDKDGDGVVDVGVDGMVASVVTGSDGSYLFDESLPNFPGGLPSGSFLVVVNEGNPLDVFQQIEDPDIATGGGICGSGQCDGDGKASTVGGNASGIDFGYQPQGGSSISGVIWRDLDSSQQQDGSSETGIVGVTVTLQWWDGTTWRNVDAATGSDGTSDVDGDGMVDPAGSYYFGSLPSGSYRVAVSETDPLLPKDGLGNFYAPTTGVDSASVRYLETSLDGSSPSMGNDFGFTALGAMGDQVYWDVDADGEQDRGEPGIAGVTVRLYTFTDSNSDGKYNLGEPTTSTGRTATTDANGYYLFDQLAAGHYLVEVDRTSGPIDGKTLIGDPDSDGVACNGYAVGSTSCDAAQGTTIGSTQYLGADFGYKPENVLGDAIWLDADRDGIKDAGELGLVGVTVELQGGGCTPGSTCPTAVTDQDGYYVFANLTPGTVYTVAVIGSTLPAGLTATHNWSGDADGVPSPNNSTQLPSWTAGSTNLDVDFGYFYSGANDISGTACLDDASADGVCNGASPLGVGAGESAYGQTSVNLYRWNDKDSDGVVDSDERQYLGSALTDASGNYSFNDLADGTYWVSMGAPESALLLTTTTPADAQIANAAAIAASLNPDGSTAGASERTYALSGGANASGLDFAFKDAFAYDYGDLPASYATLRADDGARHVVPATPNLYLGAAPDVETDGVPGTTAQGDDGSGTDDEGSGIAADPASWSEGLASEGKGGIVEVSVTGKGYLVAWIDFDGDGAFSTYGEMIVSAYVDSSVDPSPSYAFNIPGGAFDVSQGYARFRLFPEKPAIPELAYKGSASNGEVEDVQLAFGAAVATASVGNRVWLDENGDGVQDPGEPGIPNVDVYLYSCGPDGNCATEGDNVLHETTTTDANGEYIFTDLAAGSWVVRTVKLDGKTTLSGGLHPTYDENGIATANQTVVAIVKGDEHLTADFGYNWAAPADTAAPAASSVGAIGDRIWSDADGDGVQDPGEPGLGGVEVSLLADLNKDGIYGGPGDGAAITTVTDDAGNYVFAGVGAGSYVVSANSATLPGGAAAWTQTGDPDVFGACSGSSCDAKTTAPIVLAPGDVYLLADFGYQPASSSAITGTVYLDANADACVLAGTAACGQAGDNLLNGSDKGFPGVTVVLKNAAGAVVATTVTDANGNYAFVGLAPGNYVVVVSDTRNVLGEVVQSGDNDNALDSQHDVDLTTVGAVAGVNFGYAPPSHQPGEGFIGDAIFLDGNQNGLFDFGEGVEGVAVSLYKDGMLVAVAQTDENGWYQFGGLDPTETNYQVRVKTSTISGDLALYNSVDPESDANSRSTVNLGADADKQDLLRDFGYDKPSAGNSISGTIWNDSLDANGTLTDGSGGTPNESGSGIGGVTVNLLDAAGNIVASATTISAPADLDGDGSNEPVGSYLFQGLPDGSYVVEVTDEADKLAGWWLANGPSDGENGNSQPASYAVEVSGGENDATGDFGYYKEATSIGGTLWNDADMDGYKDAGEMPLIYFEVVLTITYPNGAVVVMTTMTDKDGLYRFDHVMLDENYSSVAGGPTYSVTVPDAQGMVSTHTPATDGLNDGLNPAAGAGDGSADDPSGETVTGLVKGESDFTRDFGFVGGATIGDRVWLDADRSGDGHEGIQNVGDPGLSGVTVKLYKDDGDGVFEPGAGGDGAAIMTTTTDGGGFYSFAGLPPGSYWVDVEDPAGFVAAAANQGTDDELDSDVDASAAGASPVVVTSGQTVSSLDFGYVSSKPLLGDTVWFDADGDGIHDDAEPGIKGVEVVIHPCGKDGICGNDDDNWGPDGVLGNGDDIADVKVLTNAAGNYLVPVEPGKYQVGFTAATLPAALDPSPTNGTPSREYVVAAGADVLLADFGFKASSGAGYTIGNQVWDDLDADGVREAGEGGIAGVTVDLYRDGIAIATTTTAADGTYSFSVVQTGADADYQVLVTDRADALAGMSLTSGTAGVSDNSQVQPLAINDFAANVDWADFGYYAAGIGDYVWFDSDKDGVQDAEEGGMGGVTVKLYLDSNGDGRWDSGDALVRTTTTGSDGHYLFSGIPTGQSYIVKATPPTGFSPSPVGAGSTATDSNGDANAEALVNFTGTTHDVDFGFQGGAATYSLGDYVWLDSDGDGLQDAGESGLAGVAVNLYLGAVLVATATTDAAGHYSFVGLPAGTYKVQLPDQPMLDSLTSTTGGDSKTVALHADNWNVDFGYGQPSITYALVSSFEAYVGEQGETVLEWKTDSEIGTLGFLLERLDEESGEYEAVTEELLQGMLAPPLGGIYRFADADAAAGQSHFYRVVEVAVNNQGVVSGPYEVKAVRPLPKGSQMDATGVVGFSRSQQKASERQLKRLAARKLASRELDVLKKQRASKTLKIAVSKNGLICLTAGQLADAAGLKKHQVVQLLKAGKGLLTLEGRPIAALVADSGTALWFYGQAPSRNDVGQNVYRLELNKQGLKMKTAPGTASDKDDVEHSFAHRERAEENNASYHMYFSAPIKDFWAWKHLVAYNGEASSTHAINAPHLVKEGNATLVVNVAAAANKNLGQAAPYKIAVLLNGVSVGTDEWSENGDRQFKKEVPVDMLLESGNNVKIVSSLNPNVVYSMICLDSIELHYQRKHQAVQGELVFDGGQHLAATVDGFSKSSLLALDVSTPEKPVRIKPITRKDDVSGIYSATIATSRGHKYLVTENIGSDGSQSVTADRPSSLRNASNKADYLLVAPLHLMESAQRLADHRERQGLVSMVVDIEDVQDEFSHGLAAPEAVRSLLIHARKKWAQSPKYVALIGDGSYDYKNYLGYGYPLVPGILAGTPNGFFSSDSAFADVVGSDGVPEFAVGRIPAFDVAELDRYIDKVIGYEQHPEQLSKTLTVIVDRSDPTAGKFKESADKVAQLMSPTFAVNQFSVDALGESATHAQAVNALLQGGGLLHYIGHGSVPRYGKKGTLLTADEIASMSEIGPPMLMVSMTCSSASFGYSKLNSIGESAVLRADGAAVGFFGSTGFSQNYLADIMSEGFYSSLLDESSQRLGDVVVQAKLHYSSSSHGKNNLHVLDIYNLLGDPAVQVSAHQQ